MYADTGLVADGNIVSGLKSDVTTNDKAADMLCLVAVACLLRLGKYVDVERLLKTSLPTLIAEEHAKSIKAKKDAKQESRQRSLIKVTQLIADS